MLLLTVGHYRIKQTLFVRKLTICATLFALLVVSQIIPLPLSFLDTLSPKMALYYKLSGASFGFFSGEIQTTLFHLVWFIAALLSFSVLTSRSGATAVGENARIRPGIFDRKVDFLQRAIIIIGLLAGLIGLFHWAFRIESYFGFFHPADVRPDHSRVHWPFVNPNHLAVILEMAICIAVTRYFVFNSQSSRNRRSRSIVDRLKSRKMFQHTKALIILAIMSLSLLMTLSRAAIVLTILGVALLWLLNARGDRRGEKQNKSGLIAWLKRARRPILAMSVAALLFLLLGDIGRQSLVARVEYGVSQGLDQARAILYSSTWEMIGDFSLFGVGYGCWHLIASEYISSSLAGYRLDYAHNDFLQLFAETGVFGFLLVFVAAVILVRRFVAALRITKDEQIKIMLWGGLFSVLIPCLHAMVEFPLHMPAVFLVFIMSLAVFVRTLEEVLA